MKEESEYLTLARITRPRGNKGEVAAENLSEGLRGFAPGKRVPVRLPNRKRVELEIDRAWEHRGRLILGFVGFASIPDAERLRGAVVEARRDELPPLPDGEYYLDDLVGCRMVDEASGRDLGLVGDVYEPPGGTLLLSVVDEDRKEMLVPFATEICRDIDLEQMRIAVRLPDGMEELKA